MLKNLERVPVRVVVTGSRGKSSLTRLLHAGLSGCGLAAYARVTGVIPRELRSSGDGGPTRERVIRRTSPAHVREMRWWLSQVPADADAVIVENSAVAPELQPYAAVLVSPTLVVWTTLRADHVEVWGPGREGAARTMMRGVPRDVPVAGGAELNRPPLPEFFAANDNALHTPAETSPSQFPGRLPHDLANLALAKTACGLCGVDPERAARAMAALPPDVADFRILRDGDRDNGDLLAVAFSANDVESTELLFAETGWTPEETTLLYHHRPDRNARLREFLPWIESRRWKEKIFTRASRPLFSFGETITWNDNVDGPDAFRAWRKGRGRVFACGNVAGWPIAFLKERFNLEAVKR